MNAAQFIKENWLEATCHCGGSVWLCYERPTKGKCEPTVMMRKLKQREQQLKLDL